MSDFIVSFFEELWDTFVELREIFYKDPTDFYSFETHVKATSEKFSARFIGSTLSEMNSQIESSPRRKARFNILDHDKRTLITLLGDVTFDQTVYTERDTGKTRYLLEEMLGLEKHERFSEAAEAAIIIEAQKSSYSEAAKAIPSKITKTTVMNKVHQFTFDMPSEEVETKKECRYLYIDADEDHISEQHGRFSARNENKGYIDRLAYLYEGKTEASGGQKRSLVDVFYFGGLYRGTKGVRDFWEQVEKYIEGHYDTDQLRRVYISGDGAGWIKAGADHVIRSRLAIDKFHLEEKIKQACKQMLDDYDRARSDIHELLYRKQKREFGKYMNAMLSAAENEKPVADCMGYILNNWNAVMVTLHDRHWCGCSAEGHVSHVLSDRMSSRPMGWSEDGADAMCKLRCYCRNHGEEKVLELVRKSREIRHLKRTGTDDIDLVDIVTRYRNDMCHHAYDASRPYIEKIQASIPGMTARKTIAISQHLNML